MSNSRFPPSSDRPPPGSGRPDGHLGRSRSQIAPVLALRVGGVCLGALATAVIARALQPEAFGIYTFVVSVVTILSIPHVMGLRQTLVREIAYATAREAPGRVAAVRRWVISRTALSTLLIALALGAWMLFWRGEAGLDRHLWLGLLIYPLLPVPQILAGTLHGLGRIVESQLPENILRPVAILSLYAVTIWLYGPGAITVGTALGILALALTIDGALGFVLVARSRELRGHAPPDKLDPEARRALVLSSLSFGAIAGVHVINSNTDIIMLSVLRGDLEAGLYRAAVTISMLTVFGLGVVNTVIMPRIAALHASAEHTTLQAVLTRATRLISAMALLGFSIIWLAGDIILRAMFGTEFSESGTALVILAAGQLVNALFGPVALTLNMTGHQIVTLIGISISVLVNVSLNALLVPRYGIEGAAVATAVSLAVWNLILSVALRARAGYACTILAR